MWIKAPPKILNRSSLYNVNFLWQESNVYVMDNHLAAGWCWLNTTPVDEKFNLFHIDRHYDLLSNRLSVIDAVVDKGIDLRTINFAEYESLEQRMSGGGAVPLFRYDTYIVNLQVVYPDLYGDTIFATQKNGTHNPKDFRIDYEVPAYHLIDDVVYRCRQTSNAGWVVNLDLDYFVAELNDCDFQWLANEYIEHLADRLARIQSECLGITICLSPECCLGWNKSLDFLMVFKEALKLNIDIQELRNRIPS